MQTRIYTKQRAFALLQANVSVLSLRTSPRSSKSFAILTRAVFIGLQIFDRADAEGGRRVRYSNLLRRRTQRAAKAYCASEMHESTISSFQSSGVTILAFVVEIAREPVATSDQYKLLDGVISRVA